jgi:hypothetical protein
MYSSRSPWFSRSGTKIGTKTIPIEDGYYEPTKNNTFDKKKRKIRNTHSETDIGEDLAITVPPARPPGPNGRGVRILTACAPGKSKPMAQTATGTVCMP